MLQESYPPPPPCWLVFILLMQGVIFRMKIGKISVNSCSVLLCTLIHVMYSLGITEKCTMRVNVWPRFECRKLYDLQSLWWLCPLDPYQGSALYPLGAHSTHIPPAEIFKTWKPVKVWAGPASENAVKHLWLTTKYAGKNKFKLQSLLRKVLVS